MGSGMITRACFFIIFCYFTTSHFLLSKIYYTGKEKVTWLSSFETKNCIVSYVIIDGHKYLVKQKKAFKKQLAVIRDALAAYIAKDLGIAHEVDIIPADVDFPGKKHPLWPMTIHTIASGDTVRKQRNGKYYMLRLKQYWAHPDANNEIGLTRTIITHMTWHAQLPTIVALDLIIGNSDRHCGNLCYDPQTDTFCAIDMDDTFNKDLCELACKNLNKMIQSDDKPFTKLEISALIKLRNTLKLLIRKYSLSDLSKKLYFFAKKAGFAPGGTLYNDRVKRRLMVYEKFLVQSYMNAKKLVACLDRIIAYKHY
jgi:hypothetical protein